MFALASITTQRKTTSFHAPRPVSSSKQVLSNLKNLKLEAETKEEYKRAGATNAPHKDGRASGRLAVFEKEEKEEGLEGLEGQMETRMSVIAIFSRIKAIICGDMSVCRSVTSSAY